MKRALSGVVGLVVIFVLCSTVAWGQATAQISGTVRDQSGAVLPGVEVTATQVNTGVSRSTISNETGTYVLANLALGPYRLEAALPGFRTFAQTGIVLQVNSSPVVNPVLEVGQINEQVEVQANAALVETRNQGVGSVMENQRILELPLNGRTVTDLIVLSGAATPGTIASGTKYFQRNSSVSIAGGLGTSVGYFLDGAVHSQLASGGNLSAPFPDALQEFKVETGALSAQYGMHSAGVVTMVTKSGTKEWHGDAFEFVRNGMFNARNVFALRRDTLKRNQFGGTVGGPIFSNKLFFFAGYQGTTTRADPNPTQSYVPTAAMMAGDFTAITSPVCNNGRQIALRAPFVNNRIDPSQFSKPALTLLTNGDFPKSADPCGLITWGNPQYLNDHMAIGRVDYQWNSKFSVFGRYLADSSRGPAPYQLTHNLLSTNATDNSGLAQAFTVGGTYLISPTMVNTLRLTANRTATANYVPKFMDYSQIGVRNVYVPYPGKLGTIGVTGGFNLGVSITGRTRSNFIGGNDDLTIVRGSHQFGFGVSSGRFMDLGQNENTAIGSFTFNGQITGLGMADFMTGSVFQFEQGVAAPRDDFKWYLGGYAADTWKASSKLTVNYGVRWEPQFPHSYRNGDSIFFDLDAFQKGTISTKYRHSPPGLFYPGDPGYPSGRGAMFTKWDLFSPRLGLAWDPHGDGNMSIRASYGLFTDFLPLAFFTGKKPAFIGFTTIVSGTKFDDPWAAYPGGNPLPIPPLKPNTEGQYFPRTSYPAIIPPNAHGPMVSQWNLSLQKQFGPAWLASVSYLGSRTTHLWAMKAVNPAVFLGLGSCNLNGVTYNPCSTVANTNQRRLLSLLNPVTGENFGVINAVDDGATGSYNGLLLSLQRRVAKGLTMNTNYTWSHCIADLTFTVNSSTANTYTNPLNRRADRGNCVTTAEDHRHVFNVTAVADTPQFANPTLKILAGGWKFSPIVRVSSGAALTVTSGADVALSAVGTQRPNQILGNPYLKNGLTHLNRAAFALPAAGTLGNVGIGTVQGRLAWQFDAAITRSFQLGEVQRLEFRAEAFNVTNSFRKGNPTLNFSSNTFGQISTAQDPRIMQFALKYVF
jgi:carboxypeptidase family protein